MESIEPETLKLIEDRIERLESTLGLMNPNEQAGENIILSLLENYEKQFAAEPKETKEAVKEMQRKRKNPFFPMDRLNPSLFSRK